MREIATGLGAKVAESSVGTNRRHVKITVRVGESDELRFRAMLRSIEAVVHGQFDRGQQFQTMLQYTLKALRTDVIVLCLK